MARRFSMNKRKSKKSFRKSWSRVNRRNFDGGNPMRGGIRL